MGTGEPPLFEAAACFAHNIVAMLLISRADAGLRSSAGVTAASLAADDAVVRALLGFEAKLVNVRQRLQREDYVAQRVMQQASDKLRKAFNQGETDEEEVTT